MENLYFIINPGVEATNDRAERALRAAGGFKKDHGHAAKRERDTRAFLLVITLDASNLKYNTCKRNKVA